VFFYALFIAVNVDFMYVVLLQKSEKVS